MEPKRLLIAATSVGVVAVLALGLLFGLVLDGSGEQPRPGGATSASSDQLGTAPAGAKEATARTLLSVGGEPARPLETDKLAAADDAVARSSGGPSEGIKVHGRWVIEVRDPDGGLVSRREFDNALTPQGSAMLVQLLSRSKVASRWRVDLSGSPEQPCTRSGGSQAACILIETTQSVGNNHIFNTLEVTGAGQSLTLSGQAIAARGAAITSVQTRLRTCLPDGTGCGGNLFTSSGVSPTIPVVAGQQMLVTVTISFS